MSFPLSETSRSRLFRIGRIVLGLAVLILVGVFKHEAIESEAVSASYLAGGITLFGAALGAYFGFRAGRQEVTDGDPAGSRR